MSQNCRSWKSQNILETSHLIRQTTDLLIQIILKNLYSVRLNFKLLSKNNAKMTLNL